MEKEFNFVYISTNLITNKQYVGSHATNNINDGYLGSGRYFLKTIKKYGYENFKRETLKICPTILSARELEGYYINENNTLYPNGYNISPKGGIGFKGAFLAESTKKKISKANTGKICTQETKEKISKGAKEKQAGEKHPMYGKHHTEEAIKKIKQKRKLQNEPMLGKKHSKKTKEKISNALLGKALSEEHKITLKNASLNVKKIICNHCGKEFSPWGLKNHQNAIIRKQLKNNTI